MFANWLNHRPTGSSLFNSMVIPLSTDYSPTVGSARPTVRPRVWPHQTNMAQPELKKTPKLSTRTSLISFRAGLGHKRLDWSGFAGKVVGQFGPIMEDVRTIDVRIRALWAQKRPHRAHQDLRTPKRIDKQHEFPLLKEGPWKLACWPPHSPNPTHQPMD